MMFRYQNNEHELSLMPNIDYAKNNLKILIIIIAAAAVAYMLPLFSYRTKTTILMIAAAIVAVYLWDVIFKSGTKIIFDKQNRHIYKSYSGLFRRKIYNFDDVVILNTRECGGDYYGIARKKNRYGKNTPITGSFANEAQQLRFEEEILPEIEKFILK